MANKKKSTEQDKNDDVIKYSMLAGTAFLAVYLLGLWAIDSGKIIVYILASVVFYYAIHFAKEAIKLGFFDDKKQSARGSKKANIKK